MNFKTSLKYLNDYYKARSRFNSLDELKELVKEIHENLLIKNNDPGWPHGVISSSITTSDTMEAIEWIKSFKDIHPSLNDELKKLEYFKNFSEEIASRFMVEGRNIDTHNCILKIEGYRWEWKTKDDKTPRAIRTITKSQHIPTRRELMPVIDMVESSYVALNANMLNNLKRLVTSDAGSSGYDPSKIEDYKAHGFILVGDIGYNDYIKGNVQQEIRIKLDEKFVQGTLRLINYMGYAGSRKDYVSDYANLPPVPIIVEGDLAQVDFVGTSLVNSPTSADLSSIMV